MCNSFASSITTLLIGWTGCVLLYNTGTRLNRRVALFLAYVLSMQLIEALMWKDQECSGLNQIASKIGFVQNIGQPIFAFIALLPFLYKRTFPIAVLALIAYIVTLGWMVYKELPLMKTDSYWCTKSKGNGLEWQWASSSNNYLWLVFVVSLAITMFTSQLSLYTSVATLGSLLVSSIKYGGTKSVGSWWCYYAVNLPYVQLVSQ